jgi:hypothetical protein
MSTYNFKYNVGDKIQLNKVKGLCYGDYWDSSLTLNGVYEIVGREECEEPLNNNKATYNISFTLPNGEIDTWWVGECDIKPIVRQLTFVFRD